MVACFYQHDKARLERYKGAGYKFSEWWNTSHVITVIISGPLYFSHNQLGHEFSAGSVATILVVGMLLCNSQYPCTVPYSTYHTLYTTHHTLYTTPCALYTTQQTLQTTHYIPHTIHYRPHTIQYTPHTAHYLNPKSSFISLWVKNLCAKPVKKSKAGGKKSKAVQLYTPLIVLKSIFGPGEFLLFEKPVLTLFMRVGLVKPQVSFFPS